MRVPTVLESNRRNHAAFRFMQHLGWGWGRKRGAVMEGLEDRRLLSSVYRTYDGTGNNLENFLWGSAGVDLLRHSPVAYADGISSPARPNNPSARAISDAVDAQLMGTVNDRLMSDMIYVWGQFLDHDLDLTTDGTNPVEPFNIAVPKGDPFFDPNSTGTQIIPFNRSEYDPATGTSRRNPRQQPNEITAWLDGSQIYGSSAYRNSYLRAYVGGRMLTSDGYTNGKGDLLPLNIYGLPNANDAHIVPDNQLFLAGDVRVNENIELTAIQTLFLREHNRVADQIHARNPRLNDEQIYQQARQYVIAELQVITYNEWIPALFGKDALDRYCGYDPDVNPGITNEFSTAALRIGHSMVGNDVSFVTNDGQELFAVPLKNAFSNPDYIKQYGIGLILKGRVSDTSEEVDTMAVDGLRNFLFGNPGEGGLDLTSFNIQRGRDHGLTDYNTMRAYYGLPRVTSFSQITSDVATQQKLKSVYSSVNNIDPWVGGLAEDHVVGSSTGPLFRAVLLDQLERTRDGDRYWYERIYSGSQLDELRDTTLSDIISRNTNITNIQNNAFFFKTSISGQVFWDRTANGRNDYEDPGLAGWTVYIDDNNNGRLDPTETSTVTNSDGYYTFSDVGLGTFRVREVVKSGWKQTTANPASIKITRGMAVKDVDFGNRKIDGVCAAVSFSDVPVSVPPGAGGGATLAIARSTVLGDPVAEVFDAGGGDVWS